MNSLAQMFAPLPSSASAWSQSCSCLLGKGPVAPSRLSAAIWHADKGAIIPFYIKTGGSRLLLLELVRHCSHHISLYFSCHFLHPFFLLSTGIWTAAAMRDLISALFRRGLRKWPMTWTCAMGWWEVCSAAVLVRLSLRLKWCVMLTFTLRPSSIYCTTLSATCSEPPTSRCLTSPPWSTLMWTSMTQSRPWPHATATPSTVNARDTSWPAQ